MEHRPCAWGNDATSEVGRRALPVVVLGQARERVTGELRRSLKPIYSIVRQRALPSTICAPIGVRARLHGLWPNSTESLAHPNLVAF